MLMRFHGRSLTSFPEDETMKTALDQMSPSEALKTWRELRGKINRAKIMNVELSRKLIVALIAEAVNTPAR